MLWLVLSTGTYVCTECLYGHTHLSAAACIHTVGTDGTFIRRLFMSSYMHRHGLCQHMQGRKHRSCMRCMRAPGALQTAACCSAGRAIPHWEHGATRLHPAPAHLHGQAQDPSTREGAPKGKSPAGRVHPTQRVGAQQEHGA